MLISPISVANRGALAPVGLLPIQARISSFAPAPSFIEPSLIVTLGARQPVPLTYTAAGVLTGFSPTPSFFATGSDITSDSLPNNSAGVPGTEDGLSTETLPPAPTGPAATNVTSQLQTAPNNNSSQPLTRLTTADVSESASSLPSSTVAETVSNSSVNTESAAAVTSSLPSRTSALPTETTVSSTGMLAGLYNASDALQSLLDNAAAQALATVSTDPTYAAAAAELYISAGVFHSQLAGPQNPWWQAASKILPVLAISRVPKLV